MRRDRKTVHGGFGRMISTFSLMVRTKAVTNNEIFEIHKFQNSSGSYFKALSLPTHDPFEGSHL